MEGGAGLMDVREMAWLLKNIDKEVIAYKNKVALCKNQYGYYELIVGIEKEGGELVYKILYRDAGNDPVKAFKQFIYYVDARTRGQQRFIEEIKAFFEECPNIAKDFEEFTNGKCTANYIDYLIKCFPFWAEELNEIYGGKKDE